MRERHGHSCISTPVTRTSDEVVVLSDIHRLNHVAIVHHVERNADLLGVLHMEGVVAAKIVAEVHRPREILALTLRAEKLRPVTTTDSVEGVIVTKSKPAVVAARIYGNGEHRIVIDISVTMLELLGTGALRGPTTCCTDHIIRRRNLHLEERCELYVLHSIVVLTRLTDNSLCGPIGYCIECGPHIEVDCLRVAGDVVEILILQVISRDRYKIVLVDAGRQGDELPKVGVIGEIDCGLENSIHRHGTLTHRSGTDGDGIACLDEAFDIDGARLRCHSDIAGGKRALGQIGLRTYLGVKILRTCREGYAKESRHEDI